MLVRRRMRDISNASLIFFNPKRDSLPTGFRWQIMMNIMQKIMEQATLPSGREQTIIRDGLANHSPA